MKKIQDDELQAKLDEAQQSQSAKHDDAQILKLEQKIAQLEAEKKEVEEIAKRSQFDYINLKTDFDRYQRQMQAAQKSSHVESLIAVVKKFLPFLEDLRKSLDNITEDHQSDPLTKGVHMIYDKFLKTLEHMHIKAIPSL
jgi:molecular chaperone GrpE (heat shock protein)